MEKKATYGQLSLFLENWQDLKPYLKFILVFITQNNNFQNFLILGQIAGKDLPWCELLNWIHKLFSMYRLFFKLQHFKKHGDLIFVWK